jgi:hypothetical protein
MTDLVRDYPLEGLTRDEVTRLLGEPSVTRWHEVEYLFDTGSVGSRWVLSIQDGRISKVVRKATGG